MLQQARSFRLPALLLVFLLGAGIEGCEFPGVFDSDETEESGEKTPTFDAPEVLIFQTTGGFAGVMQALRVDGDGDAMLNGYYEHREWRCRLSQQELSDLTRLLLDNGFFQLADVYTSNAVDVFVYEITFSYHGLTKTVMADDMAAPQSLQAILTDLRALVDDLLNRGPVLSLELDKSAMTQGDTLRMRLSVTNPLSTPMVLQFNTSQVYDFYAADASMWQEPPLWNWAYDKAFLQVVVDVELQPNETRIYEQSWAGLSNEETMVFGQVMIGAALLSVPGGAAAEQYFEIQHPSLRSESVVTYGDSLQITISVPDTVFSCIEVVDIALTAENVSSRQLMVAVGEGTTSLAVTRWGEDVPLWTSSSPGDTVFSTTTTLAQGHVEIYQGAWDVGETYDVRNETSDFAVEGRIFDLPTGTLRIRIAP